LPVCRRALARRHGHVRMDADGHALGPMSSSCS
jgi:hypothetical protein